jgi:hypothetical protein
VDLNKLAAKIVKESTDPDTRATLDQIRPPSNAARRAAELAQSG